MESAPDFKAPTPKWVDKVRQIRAAGPGFAAETHPALSEVEIIKGDPKETRRVFKNVILSLPDRIDYTELQEYNQKRPTPFSLEIPPDKANFNFYLIAIPLTICIPPTSEARLDRFAFTVNLLPNDSEKQPLPYDLYPTTEWRERLIASGEVGIDVSKALKFVIPEVPIDCFNLKLERSFKWTVRRLVLVTTNRLRNPINWFIEDEAIQTGCTPYTIIQAQKNCEVIVEADLQCELLVPALKLGRLVVKWNRYTARPKKKPKYRLV